MNRSYGNRLADRIPEPVKKQLRDMERAVFDKIEIAHNNKPSWARVHREDVDPIYKAGVEFRKSYDFRMLSAGRKRGR